jgi:hypothetical protein
MHRSPTPRLDALDALAAASSTRAQLAADGFIDMHAYADLHPHGYTIRVWFRVRDGAVAYEYLPRLSQLPRVVARGYTAQAELHKALGLSLARPGELWADNPLFAGLEV